MSLHIFNLKDNVWFCTRPNLKFFFEHDLIPFLDIFTTILDTLILPFNAYLKTVNFSGMVIRTYMSRDILITWIGKSPDESFVINTHHKLYRLKRCVASHCYMFCTTDILPVGIIFLHGNVRDRDQLSL